MKPTRLQLAEHVTTNYFHTPEFGVSLEEICAPSYWAHVSRTLRPGDKIELLSPSGDWWALLIVRMSGKVEASVTVLQHVALGDADAIKTPESPYDVMWRGPTAKWGIVRKDDKSVVKDQIDTKEAANQWLANHMKAMAA